MATSVEVQRGEMCGLSPKGFGKRLWIENGDTGWESTGALVAPEERSGKVLTPNERVPP